MRHGICREMMNNTLRLSDAFGSEARVGERVVVRLDVVAGLAVADKEDYFSGGGGCIFS